MRSSDLTGFLSKMTCPVSDQLRQHAQSDLDLGDRSHRSCRPAWGPGQVMQAGPGSAVELSGIAGAGWMTVAGPGASQAMKANRCRPIPVPVKQCRPVQRISDPGDQFCPAVLSG